MTKKKHDDAVGDPNDRETIDKAAAPDVAIEARDGGGNVVGSWTGPESEEHKRRADSPVASSIDAPRGDSIPARRATADDAEKRATAELVADTFNDLHRRIQRIEVQIGIILPAEARDAIITADRGNIAEA